MMPSEKPRGRRRRQKASIWVVMIAYAGYDPVAWFRDELEARRWADRVMVDAHVGEWMEGEAWPPPTGRDAETGGDDGTT